MNTYYTLDWLDGLHGLSHLILTVRLLSGCYYYPPVILIVTNS